MSLLIHVPRRRGAWRLKSNRPHSGHTRTRSPAVPPVPSRTPPGDMVFQVAANDLLLMDTRGGRNNSRPPNYIAIEGAGVTFPEV
eukprot:38602-Chlamydomonas_euryale.AAC.2